MSELHLGAIESRFADIIWQKEPRKTTELVKLAESEIGWKKTTTYTVLKRLCEKGIFKNTDGEISSLLSRDEFYAKQSEHFVNSTFGGSLPAFFAAFTKTKSLSKKEIDEIRYMIDNYREEK